MALYLGSEKKKLYLDYNRYKINLYSDTPIISGIKLLSSDYFILKDSKNVYLTAKEDE